MGPTLNPTLNLGATSSGVPMAPDDGTAEPEPPEQDATDPGGDGSGVSTAGPSLGSLVAGGGASPRSPSSPISGGGSGTPPIKIKTGGKLYSGLLEMLNDGDRLLEQDRRRAVKRMKLKTRGGSVLSAGAILAGVALGGLAAPIVGGVLGSAGLVAIGDWFLRERRHSRREIFNYSGAALESRDVATAELEEAAAVVTQKFSARNAAAWYNILDRAVRQYRLSGNATDLQAVSSIMTKGACVPDEEGQTAINYLALFDEQMIMWWVILIRRYPRTINLIGLFERLIPEARRLFSNRSLLRDKISAVDWRADSGSVSDAAVWVANHGGADVVIKWLQKQEETGDPDAQAILRKIRTINPRTPLVSAPPVTAPVMPPAIEPQSIKIGKVRYPSFDAAVAEGQRALDLELERARVRVAGRIIGSAALMVGGSAAMVYFGRNSENTLAGMSALVAAGSFFATGWYSTNASRRVRDRTKGHSRHYLEKHGIPPVGYQQATTEVVQDDSVRNIAAWVNILHAAARKFIRTRETDDLGDTVKVLTAGMGVRGTYHEVVQRRGVYDLEERSITRNYPELLGWETLKPLVDLVLDHPEGIRLIPFLEQYCPAARRMFAIPTLMRGRRLAPDWDIQSYNATEAAVWLAERGNREIFNLVRRQRDNGDTRASQIWDKISAIDSTVPLQTRAVAQGSARPVAAAAPPVPAAPAVPTVPSVPARAAQPPTITVAAAAAPSVPAAPVSQVAPPAAPSILDRIEGFAGQPRARQWLSEMRGALAVDRVRQRYSLGAETSRHAVFVGPSEVGKRTAARIYAEVLQESLGRRPTTPVTVVEVDVRTLTSDSGQGWQGATRDSGNVVLVRLDGLATATAGLSNDEKMHLAERLGPLLSSGQGAAVIVGTSKEVAALWAVAPGLQSRVAHTVQFDELGSDTLMPILLRLAAEKKFILTPEAEQKARQVLNGNRGGAEIARQILTRAIAHQSRRLAAEITREGFDPKSLAVLEAGDFSRDYAEVETHALDRLNGMVGLREAKESLARIVAMLRENRRREEEGMPATKPALHALFVGNPGTGKSTVASTYARALKEFGYLSRGQMVTAKPSELVGNVWGDAERLTRAKLDEALGGVFFLDEAHNLVTGADPHLTTAGNPFGKKVLETILTYMEEHRDDIVVIFGGYPEPIQRLLDADPGLRRRFTEIIRFADYTDDELG